jgi:polysaccharide biosynthesis protein PslA
VDQVIIALPWTEEERVAAVLRMLADYPVDVRLAPDLLAYHCGGEAERVRLHRLADRPISGWAAVFKAMEDYTLALAALLVAGIPMALIALAVRLDSPGPILFRQRRTGFNNRDFYVLKFRTMYTKDTDHTAARQVVAGDKRVTRIGAILRKTSMDELPQIFNVLRGEMSFIGPRPHAPGTRAGDRPFEQVVARYAARHRVKPGLTGLAQVRGWRGPTETEEKLIRRVESDLEYIETWTPWLDLTILVRTLLAVARMRNAC